MYDCFQSQKKRFDAGISVLIRDNSVNATEKSGLMSEYYLHSGISPDPEITDV